MAWFRLSKSGSMWGCEMTIEVYPNGTKVKIDGEITGVVTGINITGRQHVTYQVGWWNGRSRESKWLESFEVEACEHGQSVKIGFKQ